MVTESDAAYYLSAKDVFLRSRTERPHSFSEASVISSKVKNATHWRLNGKKIRASINVLRDWLSGRTAHRDSRRYTMTSTRSKKSTSVVIPAASSTASLASEQDVDCMPESSCLPSSDDKPDCLPNDAAESVPVSTTCHGNEYRWKTATYRTGWRPNLPFKYENIHAGFDIIHHLFKYHLGFAFVALPDQPSLTNICRILDIAGGSNAHARELALLFPNAEVYLVDDIDGAANTCFDETPPMNLVVKQCVFASGLPFPDNHFDYVQQRFLLFLLADTRWLPMAHEIFRVCAPGGRVEVVEIDFTLGKCHGDPKAARLTEIIEKSMRKAEADVDAIRHFDQLLAHVGFTSVKCRTYDIPCGEWGGLSGRILEKQLQRFLQQMGTLAVDTGLITSVEEYEELYHYCLDHLKDWCSHLRLYVYTAIKPADTDEIVYPMTY
jgi:ubiquinone/menaquinone biosynthesis C-methylase UbiE